MRLTYTVIDPTGNITLLVTTPVERALQRQVSAWLLRRMPQVEQVGFLEPSEYAAARLQMMGGEFCGNGTMALGAWLCRRDRLPLHQTRDLLLDVSGAPEAVNCSITKVRGCYLGTVSMPLPLAVEAVSLPLGGVQTPLPVVSFPGICHVIVPAGTLERQAARQTLEAWASRFPQEAVGLLLWEEERAFLTPLVYVKSTQSAVWEHCCGSGSAAVAAYLTERSGAAKQLSVRQDGGALAVVTDLRDGKLSSLRITGTVTLGRQKKIDVIL